MPADNIHCTIVWEEPIIYDNSNKFISVNKILPYQLKNSVINQVVYTATDFSNNTSICRFNITVDYEKCSYLEPPTNGNISCSSNSTYSICDVSCSQGYGIIDFDTNEIHQSLRLYCDIKYTIWRYTEVPDCTRITEPNVGTEMISIEIDSNINGCSISDSLLMVMYA